MLATPHGHPADRPLRPGHDVGRPGARLWYVRERGTPGSRAGISRRLRKSFERLGSTYIKLGQIVSGGEGLFPEELVAEFKLLRDQVPAESFDDVRRVVEEELGQPLEVVFSRFDEVPLAAASIAQVHAATLQHRRRGRGQGPAPAHRDARAPGPRRDGVARAADGRAHPGRRAREPARARRAVRRDDRRGAGLPARSREHARHRGGADPHRDPQHRRAAPAPAARHPAGARDGAALRIQLRRRRGHAARRHRHQRAAAVEPHLLPRRRAAARRVPRRPARRQPVRHARRPHRAARLRDHRPARRGEAPRVPPPARVRDER